MGDNVAVHSHPIADSVNQLSVALPRNDDNDGINHRA